MDKIVRDKDNMSFVSCFYIFEAYNKTYCGYLSSCVEGYICVLWRLVLRQNEQLKYMKIEGA